MEPYEGKSPVYKDYLLKHHQLMPVRNNGQTMWLFRKNGAPHTQTAALRIIEMCTILGIPVTDIGAALPMHALTVRMARIERHLKLNAVDARSRSDAESALLPDGEAMGIRTGDSSSDIGASPTDD